MFLVAESLPMALVGPFEVGLRHHVCSPARSWLDLACLLGAFPVWCGCRVLSGVCGVACWFFVPDFEDQMRFPGFRPEPAESAFR